MLVLDVRFVSTDLWDGQRPVRSKVALEAEILVLRQQINVLRRANPKRLRFGSIDRLILGGVCRLFPNVYGALAIVQPEYGDLF
jgi:hypothetical protein